MQRRVNPKHLFGIASVDVSLEGGVNGKGGKAGCKPGAGSGGPWGISCKSGAGGKEEGEMGLGRGMEVAGSRGVSERREAGGEASIWWEMSWG